MARIAGVDLPPNKRLFIGLTYIYGIGRKAAEKIIEKAGIDGMKKVKDLTDDEIEKIRKIIEGEYRVEGALKAEVKQNIKRLIAMKCYRGIRHIQGLPVRGQRTRTNARTRKGPRRGAIALKRKKAGKKG